MQEWKMEKMSQQLQWTSFVCAHFDGFYSHLLSLVVSFLSPLKLQTKLLLLLYERLHFIVLQSVLINGTGADFS